MSLIFLDTETTGKDNARLVQLAYENEDGTVTYGGYFKPPVPIEIGAMSVHNVTNEMVAEMPMFEHDIEAKQKIREHAEKHIIVAHNAIFDVGIMKTEGVNIPRYICTLKMAQFMFPEFEQHKLAYLYYAFGLYKDAEIGKTHEAGEDVRLLKKVYKHLADVWRMRKEGETEREWSDEELHADLVKFSMSPMLLKILPFGKHKGMPFSELALKHRDYLNWMYYNMQNKGPDLDYTLKHYLHLL